MAERYLLRQEDICPFPAVAAIFSDNDVQVEIAIDAATCSGAPFAAKPQAGAAGYAGRPQRFVPC